MKRLTPLLFGGCIALVAGSVRAQVSGAIQQVDASQQRRQLEQTAKPTADGDTAPELYSGESSDVGPQSVLRMKPRKTLFEAMADVQYFYTDNMFLATDHKVSADVLVSTAQFAFAPTPYELFGGSFAPRFGYRHQWFDFGLISGEQVTAYNVSAHRLQVVDLNTFDFNAQSPFVDLRWTRDNWGAAIGFDYTRLMTTSSYEQFYQEWVPCWGLQRIIPLNNQATVAIGYAGDYRFTDMSVFLPSFISRDLDDRTDQLLLVSCAWGLARQVVVQPYYQFKFTHFVSSEVGSRNDYLNAFGLAVYWTVCPNCELRAFADYNIRNSDNGAVPEYHQFDAGGGINVTFRF